MRRAGCTRLLAVAVLLAGCVSAAIPNEQVLFPFPDVLHTGGFGRAGVAIDSGWIVVGAPYDFPAPAPAGGHIFMYHLENGTWTLKASTPSPNPAAGDMFGYSVAISGSTIVVGASSDTYPGNGGTGAAYVLQLVGGVWTFVQTLTASDGVPNDHFGYSVAVSGATAAVGAFGKTVAGLAAAGAVYVYQGPAWTETKLISPNPVSVGHFGVSVAIRDNTVVAGATTDVTACAYVFQNAGPWSFLRRLRSSNLGTDPLAGRSDFCGWAVALTGDQVNGFTTLVGAPEQSSSGTFAGEAYVFALPPSLSPGPTLTETDQLTAVPPIPLQQFGASVALSGNNAVAGGGDPAGGGGGSGISVHILTRDLQTGSWGWRAMLPTIALVPAADLPLVSAFSGPPLLAMDGNTVVAGTFAGVHVFNVNDVLSPPTVTITIDTVHPGHSFNVSGPNCPSANPYTAPQPFTLTQGVTCTFTPVVLPGQHFTHWENNSTVAARTITFNSPATYTAYFGARFDITVAPPGAGSVSACPATCSLVVDEDQSVTLNATPVPPYTFTNWGGACSGTNPSCTLASGNGDQTITANFTAPSVGVTFDAKPASPASTFTISNMPGGTGCSPGSYPTGTTLVLSPGTQCRLSAQNNTLTFTHWEGNLPGSTRTISVPTSPVTYTAYFGANFNISVQPPGTGSVSGPGVTTCAAASCNSLVDASPSITLTATAARLYTFTGWGGDCAGFGANPSCTLASNNGDKSMVANFAPASAVVTVALGVKTGIFPNRIWPIVFTNRGPGVAFDISVVHFSLTWKTGTSGPCSPQSPRPVVPPNTNLQPNQSATFPINIDFSGCHAGDRFDFTIDYGWNLTGTQRQFFGQLP